MTLAQVLQLYAPLVGLLGLAFWSGILTQRVTGLKEQAAETKAAVNAIETSLAMPDLNGERLVRVETKLESAEKTLEAIERGMQGIQRQIANSMKDTAVR